MLGSTSTFGGVGLSSVDASVTRAGGGGVAAFCFGLGGRVRWSRCWWRCCLLLGLGLLILGV